MISSEIKIVRKMTKGRVTREKLAVTAEISRQLRSEIKASREGAIGFCPAAWAPKAFFFDMDSTVIAQESLVEMARVTGKGEEISKITERAMRGELDFKESLRERLKVMSGVSIDIIQHVQALLTVNPGIIELIGECRRNLIPCFLISGGFIELAAPLAKVLGFTDAQANRLGQEHGKLLGTVEGPIVDENFKAEWVQKKCDELGIRSNDACVVGDGANDLRMMSLAGVAVGYRPKELLREHIHAVINDGDHRFLIDFLL